MSVTGWFIFYRRTFILQLLNKTATKYYKINEYVSSIYDKRYLFRCKKKYNMILSRNAILIFVVCLFGADVFSWERVGVTRGRVQNQRLLIVS